MIESLCPIATAKGTILVLKDREILLIKRKDMKMRESRTLRNLKLEYDAKREQAGKGWKTQRSRLGIGPWALEKAGSEKNGSHHQLEASTFHGLSEHIRVHGAITNHPFI